MSSLIYRYIYIYIDSLVPTINGCCVCVEGDQRYSEWVLETVTKHEMSENWNLGVTQETVQRTKCFERKNFFIRRIEPKDWKNWKLYTELRQWGRSVRCVTPSLSIVSQPALTLLWPFHSCHCSLGQHLLTPPQGAPVVTRPSISHDAPAALLHALPGNLLEQ